MAKHLDFEQQEQLDEIKHFWKRYGNLITWSLIVVLGIIASWNGYLYWQRNQSAQASLLYDEVERAVQSGDTGKIERTLSDMKERFASTSYAQQAALLAAKAYYDKGNLDAASSALSTVVDQAPDAGYQAVARLRLAGLLIEKKSYDEALKVMDASFTKEFSGLAADRRGDVLALQGKKIEARAEYAKAYEVFDDRSDYRRLVEVKLNALGGSAASVSTSANVRDKR